jgi:hypothetical protein
MVAPGSDLPPLTEDEVERLVARVGAATNAMSVLAYMQSLSIDQLMAERLDLADLADERSRDVLLRWIDWRIGVLQDGAPNDNGFQ